MKKFYGGVFINNQILEEAGIKHPIKLEYYKNINYEYKYEEEKENQYNAQEQYNSFKYGISVVKTEYLKDKNKVEEKEIKEKSYSNSSGVQINLSYRNKKSFY